MIYEKNRPPPSYGEKRQAGLEKPGKVSDPLNKRSNDRWQDGTTLVTVIDVVIGGKYLVFRTTKYVYDPNVWRWDNRNGRCRRVYGEHRDRRVAIRRYCDSEQAAHAYHAHKRALGIRGILPFRWDGKHLGIMGAAFLTVAGASSALAHLRANRMKNLGVHVADNPLEASSAGEFWWADQ